VHPPRGIPTLFVPALLWPLLMASGLGVPAVAHAQSCPTPMVLGDVVFERAVPDHVSGPDALPQLFQPGITTSWTEVERVTHGGVVLVGLEQPGDAAALIVLRRASGAADACVSLVYGDAFGGLGVELAIADVAELGGGAALVVVELLQTYNDGASSTADPNEPRRVVLRIDGSGGAVVLDTRDPGMERFGPAHFHLERERGEPRIVATLGGRTTRWRYDVVTGGVTRAR
jgi:hypothetical protein